MIYTLLIVNLLQDCLQIWKGVMNRAEEGLELGGRDGLRWVFFHRPAVCLFPQPCGQRGLHYPGLRPPLLGEGEWCRGRSFLPLTASSPFIVLYHPAQTLTNSNCTIPFGLPHPTKITRIFVSHLLNEKARLFPAKRNLRPARAREKRKHSKLARAGTNVSAMITQSSGTSASQGQEETQKRRSPPATPLTSNY